MQRRRFKQTSSLEESLAEQAKQLREQARMLPPGPVRDAVEKRARQADTAVRVNAWLMSPGLQPPRE
jgi:cell division protein FtsB